MLVQHEGTAGNDEDGLEQAVAERQAAVAGVEHGRRAVMDLAVQDEHGFSLLQAHRSAQARKLASSALPCGVSTDSGWNWMP